VSPGRASSQRAAAGLRNSASGRHERGLDVAGAEDVDAHDVQRVGAAREPGVELDARARRGDLRQLGDGRVDGFGKPGAGPANFEVGVARERLHAQRKLVDRGPVDELDRVTERDAERNGYHGKQRARAVVRQRAAQDRPGVGDHRRASDTARRPCPRADRGLTRLRDSR
jgi:hypothetical protein